MGLALDRKTIRRVLLYLLTIIDMGAKVCHTRVCFLSKQVPKKDEDRRQRRKSGRFLGLSLKPFSKDTSGRHDDEKTSLLTRFGARRSSKKKNKRDNNPEGIRSKEKTDSTSSSQEGTDSTVVSVSLSDELNSDDAGHTPKTRRLQKVSAERVQSLLDRSTWATDSEGETEASGQSVKCRSSQNKKRQTGRALKRSMSLICGSSHGKLSSEVKVTGDTLPIPRKVRGRRSLGSGILSTAKNRHKVLNNKENDVSCLDPANMEPKNRSVVDFTPKKNGVCDESLSVDKKTVGSSRRRSFGGLTVSSKKRPKRQSYDRMNRERDGVLSSRKSSRIAEEPSPGAPYGLRRKWSSFKLATASPRTSDRLQIDSETGVPFVVEASSNRQSLRRRSMGGSMTPRNRRGSGIYGSVATPTFMTCGFVMTDSPPNTPPELYGVSKNASARRANSATTRPGTVPIIPLEYNEEDLPWVAMKRKRRSEVLDRSQVNRSHAGHTPLPPRKKRKSYDERLIQ